MAIKETFNKPSTKDGNYTKISGCNSIVLQLLTNVLLLNSKFTNMLT